MDNLHQSLIEITKQEICNSMCRLLGRYDKAIYEHDKEMKVEERMGLKLAALSFHKSLFIDYLDGFLKEHNGVENGVHEHYQNLTQLNTRGVPKL